MVASQVMDQPDLANKSKFHQCGDNTNVATNLNSSQTSSSDDSIKSKASTSSNFKLEPINCNSTYTFDADKQDTFFSEDDNHEVVIANAAAESEDVEGRCWSSTESQLTWRYRNLYSMSSGFDTSNWTASLCNQLKFIDSKYEDSKFEDSKMIEAIGEKDSVLLKLKTFLDDYLETKGISREQYTFLTLVKVMGHATGRCLVALFYVIVNIAPIFEIFLHVLRFIFDTILDIKNTKDVQQLMFKIAIFCLEIMGIYVCLLFIFGFIISPIVRMAFGILAKIMLYD